MLTFHRSTNSRIQKSIVWRWLTNFVSRVIHTAFVYSISQFMRCMDWVGAMGHSTVQNATGTRTESISDRDGARILETSASGKERERERNSNHRHIWYPRSTHSSRQLTVIGRARQNGKKIWAKRCRFDICIISLLEYDDKTDENRRRRKKSSTTLISQIKKINNWLNIEHLRW